MPLTFTPSPEPFTLGVEMELQVLDARTHQLTPRAPELIAAANDRRVMKEMFQSTIELVTGVCHSATEAGEELAALVDRMEEIARPLGIVFAGTGTHPLAHYNDRIVSASPRYHELLDRNQWLIRRMAVYGLHVHVGMRSGDECIRFQNFYLAQLPMLIALSASSPYWHQTDTGLNACRPTMYESHPTSGLPFLSRDWKEFENYYDDLLRTRSIESMKDIWWDLRPSPGYGTLELRICDGPATLAELTAITAFIHLLALWFDAHKDSYEQRIGVVPKRWILRENKWRAIRHGMDASWIDPGTLEVRQLKDVITGWLGEMQETSDRLGYTAHLDVLRTILERGNSASRQRVHFQKEGSMESVARFNASEFAARHPHRT